MPLFLQSNVLVALQYILVHLYKYLFESYSIDVWNKHSELKMLHCPYIN